jgi:hypothetical protein
MTPHRARELVEAYGQAVGASPWLVGGTGAPAVAAYVVANGGHVTEDFNPRTLRATIERIVANKPSEVKSC